MGVIWGVPYLFIKVAVEHMTPESLVFWRTVVAAVLLVPVAALRGQLRPLVPYWKPLLAFAAVEIAIPWYFLASAEQRLSSSLAGLLLAAVPLVGALLGWFTRTDRLDWRRALGLAIGFGGVAALVGFDLGADDIGALLEMAIVAVGYAVGPFILSRYLTGLPGLGVIAASLALTAVAYAAPAVMQLPSTFPMPAPAVVAVLMLGAVCTAVAFLLFFKLIDEVGPGPGHRHHLHQPGRGRGARGRVPRRAVHDGDRGRVRAGAARVGPGHAPLPHLPCPRASRHRPLTGAAPNRLTVQLRICSEIRGPDGHPYRVRTDLGIPAPLRARSSKARTVRSRKPGRDELLAARLRRHVDPLDRRVDPLRLGEARPQQLLGHAPALAILHRHRQHEDGRAGRGEARQ